MTALGLGLGLPFLRGNTWTPADWAKSGTAPFWDIYGTNWQDVTGTTPAEDVTDSLALMIDGGKVKLGPDLNLGTATESGSWTESGGVVTAPGSSGSDNVSFDLSEATEPNAHYLVDIPNTMPASGFYVDFGGGTGSQVGTLSSTTTSLILTCTSAGTVLRVGRWAGSPSGTIGPITVKKIIGYHASQAVTAQQPMIDEIDVDGFTHRYAYHDLDDSLTATLPDMGTQAVVWSADIAGITIEPEATIGAGSYELLADKSIQGVKAGGMTVAEKSQLITYLQRNHTPARYATVRDAMDAAMLNAVDAVIYDRANDSTPGTDIWVVIAEAAAVKIYDGSDPSLPLDKTYDFTGYTVSSVFASEQYIIVGTNLGVAKLDLVNDTAVSIEYSTATSPAIVNNAVNDVAATVLAGAGTDGTTGLNVPTIAVATDGSGTYSTSVIQDDGTVYDVADDSTGTAASVDISSEGELVVVRSDGAVYVWDDVGAIAADGTAPDSTLTGLLGTVSMVEAGDDFAFGSTAGLTLVDGTRKAFITDAYATGWMEGDCELCLCDGLTDRSGTGTVVTDNGAAVIAEISDGAEQQKITASGGSITAPVTTGGAIYGWEEIAGTLYYRDNSGWVGVSENGGTLTIADGTTVAMLKYTNGAGPSAAQYTASETDETPITTDKSACLLNGATAVVKAIADDSGLNLRHVGQSDGISVFKGLERVTQNSQAVTTTMDAHSGMVASK